MQHLHNRLLEAETDRLAGELTARGLLQEVIYSRAALHQLYLILVTRYTVLQPQTDNPTLAANLQDLLLEPDDRDAIYRPTTDFFASTVLAHRAFFVSREQAELVQRRLRPRRPAPPPGQPNPNQPTAAARRRQARRDQALANAQRAGQGGGGGGPGGGYGAGGGGNGQQPNGGGNCNAGIGGGGGAA